MAVSSHACDITYNDPDHNVIKLKFENPEKFSELIISHLTRFLDLAGNELDILRGDGECIKENVIKYHLSGKKLWNSLRKKDQKNVGSILSHDSFLHIQQLTDFLANNLTVEGLFRKPGNSLRQNQLQTALNTGASINFEKSQFHPHDVASVLKSILGQLAEPLLLPSQHFDAHVQISQMTRKDEITSKVVPDKGKRIESLQLLLLLLPTNNRKILRAVFDLLLQTAKHQKENKMNAANLAAMFTPHLIWPRSAKATDIHSSVSGLNDHIAFMIRHSEKIFIAPPYVRQSANFYFLKSDIPSSPKVSNSNLVAPSSAIKRTAAERQHYQNSTKDQTKTAMKELYNQVNSLPDSSKKKKLVKNLAKHEEIIKYQSKPRRRHRTLSGFMKKKSHARKNSATHPIIFSSNLSIETKEPTKSINILQKDHVTTDECIPDNFTSRTSLTDRITRSNAKNSPKSPLFLGISKRFLQSKNTHSHSSLERYSKVASPSLKDKNLKISVV